MDNVSEVLALRIVTAAGLEPLFGPRAKMAMVGRSVSLEGEPTHLLTHSVQRDVLTRSICESCGTWEAGTFLRRVQCLTMRSRPPAREGNEGAGRGCGKKRRLHCNGGDRGSKFAPTRKRADFLQVCLNDNDEVNPNGGSVYNEW